MVLMPQTFKIARYHGVFKKLVRFHSRNPAYQRSGFKQVLSLPRNRFIQIYQTCCNTIDCCFITIVHAFSMKIDAATKIEDSFCRSLYKSG